MEIMHDMFRVLWDVQEGNFTNYYSFRESELVLHTLCVSNKGNKKKERCGGLFAWNIRREPSANYFISFSFSFAFAFAFSLSFSSPCWHR